eukprot:scaffold16800_cov41-Attheya_sp.AAC.3
MQPIKKHNQKDLSLCRIVRGYSTREKERSHRSRHFASPAILAASRFHRTVCPLTNERPAQENFDSAISIPSPITCCCCCLVAARVAGGSLYRSSPGQNNRNSDRTMAFLLSSTAKSAVTKVRDYWLASLQQGELCD